MKTLKKVWRCGGKKICAMKRTKNRKEEGKKGAILKNIYIAKEAEIGRKKRKKRGLF